MATTYARHWAVWVKRPIRSLSVKTVYGPENPIGTSPGARTIAIVTPSITRSGSIIFCAAFPQRRLEGCVRVLDVDVGDPPRYLRWVVQRIAPPPLSE
jgi:hypothetical protein